MRKKIFPGFPICRIQFHQEKKKIQARRKKRKNILTDEQWMWMFLCQRYLLISFCYVYFMYLICIYKFLQNSLCKKHLMPVLSFKNPP